MIDDCGLALSPCGRGFLGNSNTQMGEGSAPPRALTLLSMLNVMRCLSRKGRGHNYETPHRGQAEQ
jgi:hypothetical protein